MDIILIAVIVGLVGLAVGLFSRQPLQPIFANSTVGTHAGNLTRLADAAISTRHLLVTVGSDASHVAVANAGDLPLGTCTDEAEAAGDPVNVALLGSASGTLMMVAGEALPAGTLIYGGPGGTVVGEPSSPGTHHAVGITLTASSAQGDLVEVDPCLARREVINE